RRAPPTRSRSPVTIDAHRCLKRTEQIHPTNEAHATRSERNNSTQQNRPRNPKRTNQFHKT
ncbi:hypothetical protein, partial [Atlantibacter hermannii]|uniref:hypothetical protein n=1 Tax=Atlantibacter hermannii TaxID=565 RepID=UPI002899D034